MRTEYDECQCVYISIHNIINYGVFINFKDSFVYLKGRVREREIFRPNAAVGVAGAVQSQELLGSAKWVRGPEDLGPSSAASPDTLAESWIGNRTAGT